MNTTAQQVIPSNIGAVQHLNIRPGVKLDQDGNRYADAETKYAFLRDCLAQGIRSGNLQPITTFNQWRDLAMRLNAAARACGQPEIDDWPRDVEARFAGEEKLHEKRVALERKWRAAWVANRRHEDRHLSFNGAGAMARIHAMTEAEIDEALNG